MEASSSAPRRATGPGTGILRESETLDWIDEKSIFNNAMFLKGCYSSSGAAGGPQDGSIFLFEAPAVARGTLASLGWPYKAWIESEVRLG